MRKLSFLTFCFLGFLSFVELKAQQFVVVDTIKGKIAKAGSTDEKFDLMVELSKVMMNINPAEAEKVGLQVIELAEETRNRKLMFKAQIANGVRCFYLANQKEYAQKALAYFTKALALAKQNKLVEEEGVAQLYLSSIHMAMSENDKAWSYVNQAGAIISKLDNDSLKCRFHSQLGMVYKARNENKNALGESFTALRMAEEIKNDVLIKDINYQLAMFYGEIEEYDKAIDRMKNTLDLLQKIKAPDAAYERAILTSYMGRFFVAKKQYDIAANYYSKAVKLADTLKFPTLKLPAYVSLLNLYLQKDEPQKAFAYLNSKEGNEMKGLFVNFGMATQIDLAYGIVYRDLGKYDSAKHFFDKALPEIEKNLTAGYALSTLTQVASYYKKSGDKAKAIQYYLRIKEQGEKTNELEYVQGAAKQLDSLYAQTGNMQLSGYYKGIYYQYKDSLNTLKKGKELAQEESTDAEERLKKELKQKEEQKKRRNNIQYIAIIIGIMVLFIAMIVFGMFKVSSGVIKAIGFFGFIMMFEFIFLIFKKNIYQYTKGEPLLDLLFMIGLAALLVPLHHWLEHRVLKYLTSHNRLTTAGHHIKNKIFGRSKNM